MKTIQELYSNTPIQVIIDFHIQNDSRVKELESKIHSGDLSVIYELGVRVYEIIHSEIEDFEGKESFESSYLKRMVMLVKTKQILSNI